jgi:hypothetical protein
MKKLALILALIIIPCSAFGLEMLNDNAMDQVTGQAGVSIAVDDVQIFLNIEKLAYVDCDGFNSTSGYGYCSGAAGAIALNNFQIDVLNINAITGTRATGIHTVASNDNQTDGTMGMTLYSTGCGKISLFYDYGSRTGLGCNLGSVPGAVNGLGLDNYVSFKAGSNTASTVFEARAITIDVTDALPSLTEGKQNNLQNIGSAAAATTTVGGVLIGIPTVEIYINDLSMTPVYDGDIAGQPSTALNDDDNRMGLAATPATYGTIIMQGVTFTTLSGWIEIAPH